MDIKEKARGSNDAATLLASLEGKLTPEEFARFCALTPDGQALRDRFLEYRGRHKGSTQYGYVEFAREILTQK